MGRVSSCVCVPSRLPSPGAAAAPPPDLLRRLRRWLLLWSVAAACCISGAARAGEPVPIPVVFHGARLAGPPVAPDAFIAGELAAANMIYGPLGIELVERERVPLAEAHAEIVTREDRDALAAEVRPGA